MSYLPALLKPLLQVTARRRNGLDWWFGAGWATVAGSASSVMGQGLRSKRGDLPSDMSLFHRIPMSTFYPSELLTQR